MSNRDWEIFGKEICRNVQDAIDSRDFSRLNQTINDTIYGAADEISRNVKRAINPQNHRASQQRKYTYQSGNYQYKSSSYQSGNYQYNNSAYQYGQAGQEMGGNAGRQVQKPQSYSLVRGYNTQLYSSGAGSLAGGIVLTVISGCAVGGSLGMTIGFLVASLSSIEDKAFGLVITGFFGLILLLSAFLLTRGIGRICRTVRFRAYVKMLGYKEYGNIKELAQRVRKSPKFVVKDLEKMIKKGWFKQGHLDMQKTCLITSHEAYQQYAELEEQKKNIVEAEKKAAQEAEMKKKAEEEAASKLSPEVREVIKAGEEYVRIIRECNDAIPGEEISDKIYKIEKVVDSIFDRVEKNPELVDDLQRMMEYYLPTTVKLLRVYESLDAEPVQGENILSSKIEIEKTLDTLNVAFEKLLDSLFEDTAWDLSSDISVLHTMLAQEGLTEDQMKKS